MPDCVALAIHTPAGVVHPHRRLQDRPDAARRRARRLPPAGASSARRACWRCSATARTSTARASSVRASTSPTASRRSSPARDGKIVVAMFASSIYRMQILVDLAAQFDRKVAFVGRGRDRELADRPAARLPADAAGVQIRDSEMRRLPVPGRRVHLHRVAGRAPGGAAADRDRRPPAREARPGRRGRVLSA